MKKKLVITLISLIIIVSIITPVWAATTFYFTSYSCPIFVYYDNNGNRQVFMSCRTLANTSIDYIDANGWLYENGLLLDTASDSSSSSSSASGDTGVYSYSSSAEYTSNGSHYGQNYVLLKGYETLSRYSSYKIAVQN